MIKLNLKKKNWTGALTTAILVAASILCVYVVVQVLTQGYVNFFGYSIFRVVTGSMEPTIAPGALLISQEVPIEQIQVGDIICFRSREAGMLGKSITHRVISIFENGGQLCLETRGDANPVADALPVLQSNLIGKVLIYTGQNNIFADIASFLTSGPGFMICVVLPCLWICGLMLQECVGNIRQELSDAMDEIIESDSQPEETAGLTQADYDRIYREVQQELLAEMEKDKQSQ